MSSRLRRAGSGKTKVSAIPSPETPAVSSSVPSGLLLRPALMSTAISATDLISLRRSWHWS